MLAGGGLGMLMRTLLVLSLMIFGVAPVAAADKPSSVEVWKSETCKCCGAWVKHLEANGFAVKVNGTDTGALAALKRQVGISDKLASCHTAKIGGYVVEGHAPSSDIKRLVTERPDAIGLTVPGMPVGSPGMEQGDEFEPYDVLLIKKDGATEVFAKH